MAGAVLSLNESLEIWPFNEQSQQLLKQAKAEQEKAKQRLANSTRLADADQWDQAMDLADEALGFDRSYPGLVTHRRQLPQRAAAHHTELANTRLDQNALPDARTDYHKALSYVPRYGPALDGLASTYLASGKAYEAQERYGAALLEYTLGKSYQPKHEVGKQWAIARDLVRRRVGMGVGVEVELARGGAVAPSQLGRSLSGALNRYSGDGLEVNGQASPYTLRLTITQADIDTRRVNAVRRTHNYTVREQRHNDEYDRALSRLDGALSSLQSCKAEYDQAVCDAQSAWQHARSLHPGSKPSYRGRSRPSGPSDPNCPIARSAYERELREYEREKARYKNQLSDYDRQDRAYRSAKSRARSLDSKADRLKSALRSRERDVSSARRHLSNTPKKIWVDIPYTWNYTVETHRKTGDLRVRSELIDTATGKTIKQSNHSADFTDTDTTRLNANPEIGLRRDRLELESDAGIRSALAAELARRASPWAVQAGVQHRLNQIYPTIRAFEVKGDPAAALEARVDTAVLTGVVDEPASLKLIQELAEKYAGDAD